MGDVTRELRHAALEEGEGTTLLEQKALTDQQRLAVVLQAAGLLAHLAHGGWYLASSWSDLRIDEAGLLRGAVMLPGRAQEPVQVALRRLILHLFRAEIIAGRGAGRRAARQLLARWHQTLVPAAADEAVAAVFDAAPFLWRRAFRDARATLVAEHGRPAARHLWLAGPARAKRAFLRGGDQRSVAARLAGDEARAIWEGWGEVADDGQTLVDRGRWRQAVIAWSQRPPRDAYQKRAYAHALFAIGRYAQAHQALVGDQSSAASLLRSRCQIYLGELNAALVTVWRLEAETLTSEESIELAEVAILVLALRGRAEENERWVRRALRDCRRGREKLRAHLIAALAAWDRQEPEVMANHLDASRGALEHEDLAWRWHHVCGMQAQRLGDGLSMIQHLSAALRSRRRLRVAEAGRLWSDLALGRALADDLPGAERACSHALRLLATCEGPGATTLALYNLAELRLRRGRFAGVETVLEISTAENRRAGNQPGLIQDLELWARFELAQGRTAATLARCAEALEQLDRGGARERRDVIELLAARALGWQGQTAAAAERLARLRDRACLVELEPEERPALWALAGDLHEACAEASDGVWAPLWQALALGSHPPSRAWVPLPQLEPYRAARLVFDCELVRPGVIAPQQVRKAIATLRNTGAEGLAERMESRSMSPWLALEHYCTDAEPSPAALSSLFVGAGYDGVRLRWSRADEDRILVPGRGGEKRLSAAMEGGRLVLEAPFVDRTLRALFAVVQRDLRLETWYERAPAPIAEDGIVGESEALKQALARVAQLAASELPVLVNGESGTGKELVAQRIHRLSRRCEKPFLAVNCAALSATLVLSDLFGHVRGAFTGADRDRPGVFESAQGGTVFLDEIGDLPQTAQGMLLRVLQEGEIRRLGESFARPVDVRIVAATHRDLAQMVRQGRFRQDLFFRLKGAIIELPPLAARGDDVLLLAEHFLRRHPSASKHRLGPTSREVLRRYGWPGNIRELKNVIEVAAAVSTAGEIKPPDLGLDLSVTDTHTVGTGYHESIEAFRRQTIKAALDACGDNRNAAARRLGLTRQALSYQIRKLGLG